MTGYDRLRPLLDVDDLDGSEARLREALRGEVTDEGQAEVLTQLARVASFREEFDRAHSLVDQADRLADPSGGRTHEGCPRARQDHAPPGRHRCRPAALRAGI